MKLKIKGKVKLKIGDKEIETDNDILPTFPTYIASFIGGNMSFPDHYAVVLFPVNVLSRADLTYYTTEFIPVMGGQPILEYTVTAYFKSVSGTIFSLMLVLFLQDGMMIPVSTVLVPIVDVNNQSMAVEWTIQIYAESIPGFSVNTSGTASLMANAVIPYANLLNPNFQIQFCNNCSYIQLPNQITVLRSGFDVANNSVALSYFGYLNSAMTQPATADVVIDGNTVGEMQINLVNAQPGTLTEISFIMIIGG